MHILRTLIKNEYTQVVLVSLVPILLLFLPFILKLEQFFFLTIHDPGFVNIIRNWDGPNYIVIAKTLYNPDQIVDLLFIPLDSSYFSAHFPLYPLLIRLFTPIFGILQSGVVVTVLFGILLNIMFYTIAKKHTKHPLLLTAVFAIFPPRALVLRSIIAPEMLMGFCMLTSLWLWDQKRYAWSSVLGFFAVLTKIQGLFLLPAYGLCALEEWIKAKKINYHHFWISLIPAAFIALSLFYQGVVGDFFAFTSAQANNNLSLSLPFSLFNSSELWSGTAWLEDVALYIFAIFLLIVTLYRDKRRTWFYLALCYGIFLLFLPHRDITRYAFPLMPLFLLTFEKFFTDRRVLLALVLAFPAFYFYALNFILTNQAPVADWGHFLK